MCIRARKYCQPSIVKGADWLVAGSTVCAAVQRTSTGVLRRFSVVVGLVFCAVAFPRGSIVTRLMDTLSFTPSMSIVTVDGVAEMMQSGRWISTSVSVEVLTTYRTAR